jgi:hypothetical protein
VAVARLGRPPVPGRVGGHPPGVGPRHGPDVRGGRPGGGAVRHGRLQDALPRPGRGTPPAPGRRPSSDRAGAAVVGDQRAAGVGPGVQAAGEVDHVPALARQPGGHLGRPGADPADHHQRVGRRDVGRAAGSWLSGTWTDPAMWPTTHSSSSRTSRMVAPSGTSAPGRSQGSGMHAMMVPHRSQARPPHR